MANIEQAEANASHSDASNGKRSRPMEWMKFDPVLVGTEVEGLSLAEQGAYFLTFRHLWTRGPLSEEHLRRLCREHFDAVRDRMIEHGDALTFAWVEDARSRGESIRAKRVKAGEERAKQRADRRKEEAKHILAHPSTPPAHASDSSASALSMSVSMSPSQSSGGEKGTRTRKRSTPAPLPFASEAFISSWNAFDDMRKAKRKPMTEQARAMILADLLKMGEAQAIRSLNKSTRNGWTDVYGSDDKGPGSTPQQAVKDEPWNARA